MSHHDYADWITASLVLQVKRMLENPTLEHPVWTPPVAWTRNDDIMRTINPPSTRSSSSTWSARMRVYLAGPMRGIKDFNFPAFHAATQLLRDRGFVVFNPAERDEQTHGSDISKSETGDLGEAVQKGFSLRQALRDDTSWICEHADAIALLPGWESSRGARAEKALADALGLRTLLITDDRQLMEVLS